MATSKQPLYNAFLQSNLDAAGFSIVNLTGLGAGTVTNVTGDDGSHVGLTLTVTSPTNAPVLTLGGTLNWASLNKTGSSLADLTTRAFSALQSVPSNVTNALNSTLNLSDIPDTNVALINLGITTAGKSLFNITNPGAISVVKFLADNSAVTRTLSQFISDLGLATVATSGSYTDLTSKPTIPAVATTSSVLKGDGSGNASAATARTDFWDTTVYTGGSNIGLVPTGGDSGHVLNGAGGWSIVGSGGVSGFSVVNANGFFGSVANSLSTPALTIFLADGSDATKKAHFVLSGLTTGTDRAITVPDAASTTVVADTGASNNFLTAISASGAISKAQPAFTNLSGSVAAGQMPALTGDITTSAGAVATSLTDHAVTYVKIQNVSTAKALGRKTAGTGTVEELSTSDVLELDGAATRGDIFYRGASGWVKLAAGTAGLFLKTGGSGSDPSWVGALALAGGTLTGDVIVSSATAPTSTDSVGFRGSPVNTQNANYPLVLTDSGKTIYHTSASAHTYTIPANASVAFVVGTIITINNKNGGGNLTLSITSDTLRRGDGTAGTGSRTIAANSVVAIQKMENTEWVITGKFT